jgi:hypothetical protein
VPEQLTETRSTVRLTEATGSRIAVQLISPGWGSSGYYSPKVLQEAATGRVFPAGTQCYLDHPGATEQMDRPERSVRDLAAVLTTDATWDGTALVAEARVFAPYQPLIAEMADVIGMSIRAAGDVELGEAEGRTGRIVTRLAEGTSVDFVTRAGRGGRITQLLESARAGLTEARNVGQHLESRMHQDFTNRADEMAAQGQLTRDERIHLSGAVGKGLSAFNDHLQENAPQLYQRDLWDEPTATPAVSEAATAATTNNRTEGLVPELTEAEVTALRDQAAQAAEAQRQLAEATARLTALTARDTARPLISAQLAEATTPLPLLAQARVVEAVLAAGIPTGEQGAVDTAALTAAVEAAATREAAYVAALATPAPLTESWGSFVPAAQPEIVEADVLAAYDAQTGRTFGRTVKGN